MAAWVIRLSRREAVGRTHGARAGGREMEDRARGRRQDVCICHVSKVAEDACHAP